MNCQMNDKDQIKDICQRQRDHNKIKRYLPLVVIYHDIVGFDVSVHDAMTVAVFKSL